MFVFRAYAKFTTRLQNQKGVLWRLDSDRHPVAIPVTLGASDGSYTEISGAGIEVGIDVIIRSL